MSRHIDCKSKTIIDRHWSQVTTTKHIWWTKFAYVSQLNLILKLRVNDIHEDGDLESHSFLAIDSLTLSLWVSWSHNIDNQINYLHIYCILYLFKGFCFMCYSKIFEMKIIEIHTFFILFFIQQPMYPKVVIDN
jgi:hypothetical protein